MCWLYDKQKAAYELRICDWISQVFSSDRTEDAGVAAPELQAGMRDLWHGYIVHARDYALAVHAGNDADGKAAADAVVENARQISDAVAGFYGEAGGEQMMTLLAGH